MMSLLNKNFKCRGRKQCDDEILQPSHCKFMRLIVVKMLNK